ncbi:MAG: hypothetical protein D3910_08800, partial [Candidatus Electrothrix sp. ATG2]|nr:hypothetical protein [Candidatus Electrothrix sp. ATG2]
MKAFFVAAFKFLLLFTLLLLIGLFTYGVVLWMQWPWWVAFFFLLGYAGLYLSWLFLRKILLRRREQNFIHQVVEQDNEHFQDIEGDSVYELQKRWQEALETLKSSHLAKQGNPLYVLPWYMIIGESGSGKSTAIQSAGLTSPFTETSGVGGVGGTRNCDWWFLEQAVILDTAGRYAIPLDEGRDKEEWQKFLSLLVKYRKKEPLNGLVVTIAADKLMQADQDAIIADGRSIRQRIDELMRVLGKVFPVYVLVTKCDLIQGMNRFCEQLSEEQLRQTMGGWEIILNSELGIREDSGLTCFCRSSPKPCPCRPQAVIANQGLRKIGGQGVLFFFSGKNRQAAENKRYQEQQAGESISVHSSDSPEVRYHIVTINLAYHITRNNHAQYQYIFASNSLLRIAFPAPLDDTDCFLYKKNRRWISGKKKDPVVGYIALRISAEQRKNSGDRIMKIILISPKGPLYRAKGGIFKKSLRYQPLTLTTLAALIPEELDASVELLDEGIQDVPEQLEADLIGLTAITQTPNT